ncbi:CGNR zinc finger domain-containing protein [Mycolicibacterium sp.]|uniref:CGNR zinc finger domain-containing protein n=1 Tax=Mycolicibacterium sp. TaxID=2320850 RepID=UPI003D099977
MTAGPTTWPGDDESKPAPGPLRTVQALVNTVERPDGADRLADPDNARPWLVDSGLLTETAPLTDADRALLVDVREAMRAMLVHNAGGPAPSAGQLAPLHRLADAARLRTSVGAGGELQVSAAGDELSDRLATLLVAIRDAQRDGSWTRLKACRNDECQWAFYDASRNHAGSWCEMASCGNKLKNRQFRARRRAQG